MLTKAENVANYPMTVNNPIIAQTANLLAEHGFTVQEFGFASPKQYDLAYSRDGKQIFICEIVYVENYLWFFKRKCRVAEAWEADMFRLGD